MTPAPSFLPWLGIFETLRVEAGRPLFLEAHWATFCHSAAALGLPVPADLRERAQALPAETGRWRWMATPEETRDLFQVETDAGPETYRLEVSAQRVGSHNWDARHKTLSYLTHWQARQAAKKAWGDEAVLLNERNEVASGAMTNIFWVSDGVIHTPDVETGCRDGVVRQWVVRQGGAIPGRHPLAALVEADEIFVTNSWIGIKPVTAFGGTLPVGPITATLQQRYREAAALT